MRGVGSYSWRWRTASSTPWPAQDVLSFAPLVDQVLARARAAGAEPAAPTAADEGPTDRCPPGDLVMVHTDQVEMEEAHPAGAVHVGHQMWQRSNAWAWMPSCRRWACPARRSSSPS